MVTFNFIYIMKFKTITEHFDFIKDLIIFEALMPDGRYIYYEFINHKIIKKITWKLK